MAEKTGETSVYQRNIYDTCIKALIAMGLVYPAVHFTMLITVAEIKMPLFALWLFPALFFMAALFFFQFKPSRKHIQPVTLILYVVQMGFLAYLLYLNNSPRELWFTYWIYAFFTANFLLSRRDIIIYLFLTLGFAVGAILLVGNKSSIPTYLEIFWFVAIYIIIYVYISTQLDSQMRYQESQIELKRQQDEMNELLNSLSAMICYKDTHNRIIRLNDAMASFLGKPKEFFENVSLYDIIPKGRAHTYHEEDLMVVRTGKAINNVVEEVTTPLGEKRWIRSDKKPYYDNKGNIKGVVIFSVDITEQISVESRLQQSEELFRRIFDQAPYGVIIMDLSKKILHANHSICTQLGYDIEELSIFALKDIVTDEGVNQVYQLYDDLSPSLELTSTEVALIKKNEDTLNVNLLITQIKDENDIPLFNLGMIENIAEKRKVEKKLEEYSKELEESNKDLEQFAYIISHDLREPLRTITSYTQLLKRRYSEHFDDDGMLFMDFVVNGAKRMNNLINDLLLYSRVGRDRRMKQAVKIEDVIAVVKSNLGVLLEETEASISIKDVMPQIYCNKPQITTLFQNLISNAVKYRKEGVIPQIEIGVQRKGNNWQFYVKDNGIGIPQESLEIIFLIFKRLHTDKEYAGTGVGLAICKRIVQTHGGDIWARSIKNEGTTFYFTLPIKNFQLEE